MTTTEAEGNITVTPQTAASTWTLDAGELQLEGAVAVVDVRVPTGSVTIAVATGASPTGHARVIARDVVGPPILVQLVDGVLTVRQPGPQGVDAVEDIIGSVVTAFGSRRDGRRRASLTVLVPSPVDAFVRTVSAPVMFSGLANASADTVSGAITVSRSLESLSVHTVSGPVEAAEVDGELHVDTVSGDVTVVNASIHRLRARTVSGDVIVDGALRAGDHEVWTVSGTAALRIDTPDGFALAASSTSGRLTCAVGEATHDSAPASRHLRAATNGIGAGAGGARLRSWSMSGDLTVVPRSEES